ncbi:signal recognition particle 14 kDa protein-like, partial [Tachypleus tridentatus]|uniref:signal recognition particle 14 kDa protein-like n=1 Tax=Tachypleus tridentatus TaxID=6853 RepID=UPI003FD0F770
FSDDGRTKPHPRPSKTLANPPPQTSEYKCLVRAHLGNKKIATVINAKDVNRFQVAYASLLKGNMDGLKKKIRRKLQLNQKPPNK